MRALLVASALLFSVGAAHAEEFTVTAMTEEDVAISGDLDVDGMKWSCLKRFCVADGAEKPSAARCAALVKQVGQVTYYGRQDAMLSKKQLRACNDGSAYVPPAPPAATAVTQGDAQPAGTGGS